MRAAPSNTEGQPAGHPSLVTSFTEISATSPPWRLGRALDRYGCAAPRCALSDMSSRVRSCVRFLVRRMTTDINDCSDKSTTSTYCYDEQQLTTDNSS